MRDDEVVTVLDIILTEKECQLRNQDTNFNYLAEEVEALRIAINKLKEEV
jgi:hypothetical protein